MSYGCGVTSEGDGVPTDRSAERERWVAKYRGSGQSLRQFAQREGVSVGQLRYWVYGPAKARAADKPGLVFQEVRLAEAAGASGRWSAEVGLPDGTTVRLGREVDPEWAKALVDGLRRPC